MTQKSNATKKEKSPSFIFNWFCFFSSFVLASPTSQRKRIVINIWPFFSTYIENGARNVRGTLHIPLGPSHKLQSNWVTAPDADLTISIERLWVLCPVHPLGATVQTFILRLHSVTHIKGISFRWNRIGIQSSHVALGPTFTFWLIKVNKPSSGSIFRHNYSNLQLHGDVSLLDWCSTRHRNQRRWWREWRRNRWHHLRVCVG